MDKKTLIAKLQENWLWQKPLKFVNNAVNVGFITKQAHKFDSVDFKLFMYFLYWFKNIQEPSGKSWKITWMLNNAVLEEYEKFLEMKLKEPDLYVCVDYFYKKYPIQQKYGLRGFWFLVDYIRLYIVNFGKIRIIDEILKSNDISGSVFKVLGKLKVDTKVEKGSWQESEQKEVEKYKAALIIKDFNLALTDRGRKMLLTVEWGRKLMAQCYWCSEFLERNKNMFDCDIKKMIAEYDNCITKQEREIVTRKFEPEAFDEKFDCEYKKQKNFLTSLDKNNIV